MSGLLSVAEAAMRIGVSARRIRALIAHGTLPAGRIGRQWVLEAPDVEVIGRMLKAARRGGKPIKPLRTFGPYAIAEYGYGTLLRLPSGSVWYAGKGVRYVLAEEIADDIANNLDPDWVEMIRYATEPQVALNAKDNTNEH